MLHFLYIFAYNVIFRGRAVYPLLSRYGDKHLHLVQPLCVVIIIRKTTFVSYVELFCHLESVALCTTSVGNH